MQPTILIVDDEPVAALTLAAVFERSGYRVLRASTAPRARAAFESEAVAAVIMDDQLDDAHRLGRHFKQLRPSAPVIVFSSIPTNPDAASFADLFVPKPEDPRRLLQQVAQLLEKAAQHATEQWESALRKAA